jgi:hypothetical protein
MMLALSKSGHLDKFNFDSIWFRVVVRKLVNAPAQLTATNLPQGRVANNYVIQDTVTHLRGNHSFRFGLDLLQQRSRQFAPIVERGLLTFRSGGGFTALGNFIDNFAGSGGGTQRDSAARGIILFSSARRISPRIAGAFPTRPHSHSACATKTSETLSTLFRLLRLRGCSTSIR